MPKKKKFVVLETIEKKGSVSLKEMAKRSVNNSV